MDIHKAMGKIQRPKRGLVLPYHKYTGLYNPLDEQLDENDELVPGQHAMLCNAISTDHDSSY